MEGPQRNLASSHAVNTVGTLLFALYRSHFSGAVALVVPNHTREAIFQLFCDLRANTPKDARFLRRHARALQPHTLPGWLALASALGFGFSSAVALTCTTALLSLAGVWAAVGLAIASGAFLASVLSVLALSLFVAALVSGAMAAGALSAYIAAITVLGCLRLAGRVLLGARHPQQGPQLSAADQSRGSMSTSATGTSATEPVLALPSIRTIPSPRKHTSPISAGVVGSPLASPRKVHPAAAAASAAFGEQSGASSAPPAAPQVVHSGASPTANGSGMDESSHGMPSGGTAAAAAAELIGAPKATSTPPAAATGAPRTPHATAEPAESTQQTVNATA